MINVDRDREWKPMMDKIMAKLNSIENVATKNKKKLGEIYMKVDYLAKEKKVK